jgi:sodium-coupled monocarboxylate transporter 8/12
METKYALSIAKMQAVDYGVVVIYMLVVIGVGYWFSRREDDTESYLLGGRNMPWWLIGVSYVVSLLSTLTLVGVPGEAYANGVTLALGSLLMPIFAVIAFHIFVRFYFVRKVFTPFDYLERRFGPGVRALAAGFFWLSRAIYLGLVLYASAKVFAGADNWPIPLTIAVVGGVGTVYTILGGFKAVVWSDFIQFLILTFGIFLIIAYATADIPDGPLGIISYAFENGRGAPELTATDFYSFSFYTRVTLIGVAASIFNEQLFFNSSDQIALQRLLSTSNYNNARRSLFIFISLVTPVLLVLWFLGLAMFAFYSAYPLEQRPTSGDAALFRFIATQLPTPVPGLIIAAMLAAIMSTLDSGINSLATVATKDIYARFCDPRADESAQVTFSRVVTLCVGVLAVGIGILLNYMTDRTGASVLETSMAWMALSVALPPVFIIGIFSRRATSTEAILVLLTGWIVTAVMLIWHLRSKSIPEKEISFMMVGIPGPIVALLAGWLLAYRNNILPDASIDGVTIWKYTR